MSIQASNSKNLYCAATPSSCPFNLSVSFTETSTSVERNTSSLVIEGYIKPNGTWFDTNYNNTLTLKWYDSKNGWETVKYVNIQDLMSNDAFYISSTLGVEHNADGTLSGYALIEWTRHSNNASVIYVPPSGSVSTLTTALTTIPRASSISSLSGTSLGSSVSVGISRASSSFTHKVEWKIGSSSYVTASSNATTSASFTPDVSYASQYPNGTSCTCTVRVTTYNGSTQIGSSVTSSCTLSVPSSVIPTCSDISLSRIDNGVPSSWGVYVQGYSQVTASISGSGIHGSSISSYYISGAGKSTNSSSLTSGVLTSSGTYSFSAYVTDSRGRTSSSKSASVTVYAYSKPSISLTAQRCDSSGNVSSSGTYLKITCNYSYASVNGKNSITRSVSCNGASNTSFSSGTSFVLAANCSVTSMYTVTASISDALGNSATANVLIPTDERVMNVKSNGKGVAFGSFATIDNALYTNWDVYARNFIGAWHPDSISGAESNKIVIVPSVPYSYFGSSTDTYGYFKNWLKWICSNYPNNNSTVFIGNAWPNGQGLAMVQIYDTNNVSSEGLPQYSSGLYVAIGGDVLTFTTSGYSYFFNSYAKSNHTHDCLPLSGGTLTGGLQVKGLLQAYNYVNSYTVAAITMDKSGAYAVGIGPDGTDHRIRFGPCKNISDGTWVEASTFNKNEFYFQGSVTVTEKLNVFDRDCIYHTGGFNPVWTKSNTNRVTCQQLIVGSSTYLEVERAYGTVYGCTAWASDKSLKEHIKNTEVRHALDKLSKLKHVEFDWKDNDGHVPLGYVADDVKEILPCLVFGVKQEDGTELLHINHTTMIPLITMGIQELIEEKDLLWNFDNEVADCIISLRKEVDELKETVKELSSIIETLKTQLEIKDEA